MVDQLKKFLFSSFRKKLIYSYVILAFFPIVIIGDIAYKSTANKVKEHTKENVRGTLMQIKDNIQYKQELVKRSSEQLYSDMDLQRILKDHYKTGDSYIVTRDFIIPRCKNAVNVVPENIFLTLYINNKTLPEVNYNYRQVEDPLFGGANYQIQYMDSIIEKPWFANLNIDNYHVVWKQVDNDKKYGNLTMIRKVIDFQELTYMGFITTTIRLNDLFKSVDYNKISKDSYLLVTDDLGNIVYNGGNDEVNELWESTEVDHYMIIQEKLPETNWSLKALVPTSRLNKEINNIRNLMVIVSLNIFAFVIFISFIISKYLSKNIKNTVTAIESFSEGDFKKRIYNKGNDEFSLIANAFNNMADTIDKLIKEVYESKLQKKEIELEFLQSQINPHFLYNTLSSISQLALLGAAEELNKMIMSLSKFYRLTLNQGKLIIPIGKELEQVSSYIEIQKIKYGKRLEVSYEIDEKLLECDTVKFILQPFVENAEEHAWFDDTIHIKIKLFSQGNCMFFRIIDNGAGMTREKLEKFSKLNSTEMGYGIYNVNQRIKLQFGEEYGIKLFSRLGIGTVVEIKIPRFKITR
jgi:two-component system, sensor histidine kinase YesM